MIVKLVWWRNLQKKSAQNHVVVICVCFMLISMLILGCYMAGVMYSKSYDETNAQMQLYTEKTVENLEQSFSFITNTAMAVATTKPILEWVDNPSLLHKSSKGYYDVLSSLKNEIKHILAYSSAWKNNYISYIAIFVNDQLVLYSYTKPLSESSIVFSANQAYKKAMEHSGERVMNLQPFVNDNRLFDVRIMKQNYAGSESMAIMVATDEEALRRHYTQPIDGTGVKTYLIDEDGIIFSTNEAAQRGKPCAIAISDAIDNGKNILTMDSQKYVCIYKPIDATTLTFVNLVPQQSIIAQAWSGMPTFIFIALGLCLALLASGYYISRHSTAFIHELANGMEQIKQKNYDVKMKHYRNDAVDVLSDAFNAMTSSMKTLVQNTYEARIMLQETQIEFLQQQVNPHFLFNILLTIQIKAKLSADDSVYEMLTSLSGFLRTSLYSSTNMFTVLGEEMQCVQYYLYLQQQRFEGKLHYLMDIPASLEGWPIPRLTLEPIVENAIVHGMEDWCEPVSVTIIARREKDCLVVTIADNGAGFDVAQLNLSDIQPNELNDTTKLTRDRIGLRNTNSRLRLLYGDAYALQIQSSKGRGTSVSVRIPQKQEGK